MTSSIPDGKLKNYELLCNKSTLELTPEETKLIPIILNQLNDKKPPGLAKRVFSLLSPNNHKTAERVNGLKQRLNQKQKELDQFFFIKELLNGGPNELLIPFSELKKLHDPVEIAEFIAYHSQNIPFLEHKVNLAKRELETSFDIGEIDKLILHLLNSQSDEDFMKIFFSYKDKFQDAHFLNFSTLFAAKILSHPSIVKTILFGIFEDPHHKNIQANLAGGIIYILCDKGSSRPIDKESADDLLAGLSLLKNAPIEEVLRQKSLPVRVNEWSEKLAHLHPSHLKSKQELKSFYQRVDAFSKTSWIDHFFALFSKSQKNLLTLKKESANNIPKLKSLIKNLKEYGKPLKTRRLECESLEKSDYVRTRIQELRKSSDALENSHLDRLIKTIMEGTDIQEALKEYSSSEPMMEQLLLRGLKYPEFIYYLLSRASSEDIIPFQEMYRDLKSKAWPP